MHIPTIGFNEKKAWLQTVIVKGKKTMLVAQMSIYNEISEGSDFTNTTYQANK